MRFDIALIYLINRFFYRFAGFFIHWYSHSWQLLTKRLGYFAVVFYLVWALIPVYLAIRIFFIELP